MLKNNRNIVLIGMSGCGKTTVGRVLAQMLDMSFVDADAYLEEKNTMSISEIFSRFGEPYFRSLEKSTLQELAGRQGTVIATGGGAVKSHEAMQSLKDAHIVFIKRDIERIIATADSSVRPLFTNPDAVRQMYNERLYLYEKYCDLAVENNDINKCAREIVRLLNK